MTGTAAPSKQAWQRIDDALALELAGIAAKLKATRLAAGATRAEVAHRIGVSKGRFREYEQGRGTPTLEHLLIWCHALHLHLAVVGSDGRVLRPRLQRITGETRTGAEARRIAVCLKTERLKAGRSQQWAADRLRLARPSMSRLENAGSCPRLLMLARWAALYGATLTLVPRPTSPRKPETGYRQRDGPPALKSETTPPRRRDRLALRRDGSSI